VSRSLNKVILIGNLGQDPEVRSIANGGRVANFSLATSRQWSGQGGDKQEKTEWHRVVAWNNSKGTGTGLADVVEKFVKKGDKLYVEGRIEYRSWQDKEGQTRYTTEIIASEIIMLSGKGGAGEGGYSPARAGAAASSATPAKKDGKEEAFGDFPEALDSEDDDLPF
jgi:single-strand DNA-binding protein